MRKIVVAVIVFIISINGVAQNSFIKDSLDLFLSREMKRWNLPGLAIAIVKDGKVVVCKGYGYADEAKKIPVTENTVFQIASNSKAFTGTAIALLEHYGKLKLSDKVNKHLTYFKMKDDYLTQNITINDVLSHRIGYATFQTDLLNWACNRTRKELIQNMANVVPQYGFREKYGYCNIGFVTAGEIIPAVSDTTWDDYLKHHFFVPLQMKNTSTHYREFMANPNRSKAYSMVKDKLTEIMPANVDNIGAAGGITSCVKDLANWVIMQLDNGKFDNKQIVPKMVIARTRQSSTIVGDGRGGNNHFNTYGLGWFMKDENGKKVVTHDGGANGFLSKTVLIPQEKTGFVILTNSDAQYLFEALGEVLTKEITGQAYFDYSGMYFKGFTNNSKTEHDSVKKWNEEADKFKLQKDVYKKLEGVYSHPVYGKIAVKANEKNAEMYFEFHPQYKGEMRWMGVERLVCEYNDAIAGNQVLRFFEKDGKEILDVKVNDFVDMDHYLFEKISNEFKPFN